MAETGKYFGDYLGEWLGAQAEGGISANISCSSSISASLTYTQSQVSQDQPSGGYEYWLGDRKRTKEEIEEERIKLGIIPRKVKKQINKIAKKQTRDLGYPTDKAIEELKLALEAQHIAWQEFYADLLDRQRDSLINMEIRLLLIKEMQEQEELEILLLLS